MFTNAIRIGDFIYGSDGDFGPALLTAVHAKTGETIWQERGFGRSSLLYADDKAILIDEERALIQEIAFVDHHARLGDGETRRQGLDKFRAPGFARIGVEGCAGLVDLAVPGLEDLIEVLA